jgi:hypothetical protein
MIVAHFLILSIFVSSVAFYGFVFWHWRNDVKQHDSRHKNSSRLVTDVRGFGSWLD